MEEQETGQHNSSEVTGQNSTSLDEVSAGMSSTPLDLY